MEKTYDPHSIEQNWYQHWEQAGYFKPSGNGPHYCIMLPPPNVTGSLHMGHGFQQTLMDALIRFHRMRGFNTLWQGGVDHAGIATQIVVERQLESEKLSRQSIGREAFEKRVWQWKNESGGMISRQLRRLGSSIDWSRDRFTMDEGMSHAVREAFVKLYKEGLIYRGKRLVNWDPKLQSAVSDLEVITQEEAGQLWHIRYPLVNSADYIVVATTRPETLFGDVAVAVHPDDERYKHLIGKQVKLPLTDKAIPIIADEYVDPNFGTGCVKITPAHDFNDYAVGQRHKLPLINILTPLAILNENVPAAYQNLDRVSARKKVVHDLQGHQLIEKITNYTLSVPRCERTGEIIEPYLTDQWYVNMQKLAPAAIAAVENDQLRFIPKNWTKIYLQWLNNIQDWCISRQLWWGHRIPAWHDEAGNIYVGHNEAEIRQDHKLSPELKLTQDDDVLDTWFSAALWPIATLGWPDKTPELQSFYPTSVLITGFDIIFFWVARMVMFGMHFTGQVPFRDVYITGLIRDHQGHKMSKSKGNVLDPIDIIDGIDLESLIKKRTYGLMQPTKAKQIADSTRQQFPDGIPAFGTDALRFTFCALANTGRDIKFDLGRVGGYRNFCNKLWNASRFVILNTEAHSNDLTKSPTEFTIADQWIWSRLQKAIKDIYKYFADYRFDLLAQAIYEFTWGDYCDWYVELAKIALNSENYSEAQKTATRYTLINVLENLLRLTHPMMPFITEEIWQRISALLHKKELTIQMQKYPELNKTLIKPEIEDKISWLQNIVISIRNIRSEMQISPGKTVQLLLKNGAETDHKFIKELANIIQSLAKISTLQWLDGNPPPAATAIVGELQLFIPMADLIDKNAELARLRKEIEKINLELNKSQQKLSNENYVNKAPAEVVAKERERMAEWKNTLEKLQAQLRNIEKM